MIPKRYFTTLAKATAVLVSAALFSLLAFLPLAPAASANVGINKSLNYQGRLLTAAGAIVPDGFYNMEFKIYQDGNGCVVSGTSPCGGTLKWTEDWVYGTGSPDNRVKVTNGYFSLQLGTINTTLGSAVDWDQNTLWLSVNIGNTSTAATFAAASGDGEMLPFKRLTAAPYALQSANSDSLQGVAANQFARLDSGNPGNNTFLGNTQLFKNNSNSTTAFQIQPSASTTPVLNVDTTNSRVGIGTATPAYPLDVVGDINTSTGLRIGGASICTSAGCNDLLTFTGHGLFSRTGNTVEGVTCANGQTLTYSTGTSSWVCGTGSGGGGTFAPASYNVVDNHTGSIPSSSSTFTTTATQTLTAGNTARATVTGNLGNNSRADLAVANSGANTVSVYLNNGSTSAPYPTTATQTLTTGNSPVAIITGNFGNNGRTDLAVVNSSDSTVSIYLNNGSTSAPYPTTATQTLTAGNTVNDGTFSIVTGNFGNTGRASLAVVNSSGGSVSVFLNNGSTSTPFPTTATQTLTVGANPSSIITGNFGNNSRADLAVVNQSGNSVSVFLNNGSTSTPFPTTATQTLTTGTSPNSIVTGNFGNNGRADLAVVNISGGTVSVFLNNSGTSTPFPTTATQTLTTGGSPQMIITGNFGNNSRADLAAVSNTGNSVSVFLNNGGTSTPFPTTATQTLTVGSSSTIITGNFGNNGRADLAALNNSSNSVSVFLNNGSTSTPFPTTVTQTLTTGASPAFAVTGNLGNNSRADLAVTNLSGGGSVSIFLNNFVTPGGVSQSVASSDGFPRVAYYDAADGFLKFAQCTNAACTSKNTTTVDSSANVGQYASMALDSTSFAHIAYYDATNGHLKYIQCTNAACTGSTPITIDSSAGVGTYVSLKVNGSGVPSISYYDATNSHLKYILCGNAACSSGNTTATIDASVGVGTYGSLALNGSGVPSISYYDIANGHLKYILCGNAACSSGNTTNTVDSSTNVGTYSSIALNSGVPSISYYDVPNVALKIVLCGNAACGSGNTITTVDNHGNVGQFSSISMGLDGFARISYFDATNGNGDLKYAACTNASCSLSNILYIDYTVANVGVYTSVSVGADGFSRVSYYDTTNGYLKLWVEPGATTGGGGSASALSSLTGAIVGNNIDSFGNSQTWNWSTLTGAAGMTMTADTLTSGGVLALSSASTGLTGNLASFTASGNNAGVTGNVLALNMSGSSSTGNTLKLDKAGSAGFALLVTTGAVSIGDAAGSAGNNVTFNSSSHELTLNGTARHQKTLALTVEYPGAVLDASGTNNTGTLTAPFDATQREGYYKWTTTTATPAQTYDVVLTMQVPSDWAAWNTTTPMTIDDYTTDLTNGTILGTLIDTAGTTESAWNTCSLTPASASTWTTKTGCTVSGTYTAGGFATLRLRMSAMNNSQSRIGTIKFNYLSKF